MKPAECQPQHVSDTVSSVQYVAYCYVSDEHLSDVSWLLQFSFLCGRLYLLWLTCPGTDQ